MPAIQVATTVNAATSNPNLFNGSAFEYARGRSALSLGVTAAADGTYITIQSGADVVLEESPPYIADQFPIVPDQMFYNDIMEPFDRLRVAARNGLPATNVVHRAIALITQL